MREYRPLADLRPWGDNPRAIDKTDFARLRRQITRLGQYKPLLITSDNMVIGGNMRLEAMKSLGFTQAWVCVIDFKQRDDGKWYATVYDIAQEGEFDTKDQAIMEYALSDNDRAGYYLEDKLAEQLAALPKIGEDDLYRFDLGKLTSVKELMSRYGPELKEDDFDGTPPDDPVTKSGDVYQLGHHRLMCGDATSIEDVKKLMDGKTARMVFTDPPYNVDYSGGMGGDGKQHGQFLFAAISNMIVVTRGGFYICMSSSELHNLWKAFTDAGAHWQSYIIWAKDSFTLSRSDYQHQMEPILYGLSEDEIEKIKNAGENLDSEPILYGWTTHDWYGGRKQGNVWNIARPKVSKEHPTMKPIELVGRAVRNSSLVGDIVLDTFGGSGSTIIACEQTDRIGYSMELDPGYCDVIVRRWEKFTGGKATLCE